MNIELAAKTLKELGHPTRLAIFKRLVKSGEQGLPVGILKEELAIPNSTLTHHLSSLISANLLSQVREGRILHCQPNYTHFQAVIDFLQEECCMHR